MIGVVRERLRIMPQVTEAILEAMDRIAQQCLDTFDEIEASIPGSILDNDYLQKPFDTLEVRLIPSKHVNTKHPSACAYTL